MEEEAEAIAAAVGKVHSKKIHSYICDLNTINQQTCP